MLQSIAALGLSELQVWVLPRDNDVERRNSDAMIDKMRIDRSRFRE
jgi:hypothetical protein